MLDEVFGWVALSFCLGGIGAGFMAVCRRPRGLRCRCRGSRTRLALLNPFRWFVRGWCWYDLSGLPLSEQGLVRCPECWNECRPSQFLRDGSRHRWWFSSLVSWCIACGIFAIPWLKEGSWARPVPTIMLAMMDRSRSDSIRQPVRQEVARRINDGMVADWSASALARSLVRDLHQDDLHWNAERAVDLLKQLWPQSRGELERCLTSSDRQARLFAAQILRQYCEEPSDALLAASIEDLRDDTDEVRYYLSMGNAQEATEYLVGCGQRAAEHLDKAMRAGDPQQRLLAAAIAGETGQVSLIDQAAPILIEHLRDNQVSGDSIIAAPALFRFGPPVLPYLKTHADSSDKQLAAIMLAIMERIEHPERPLSKLQHPLPRITVLSNDPLTQSSLVESARRISWP